MMSLINYRLRITLNDSRQIVGQLLAFDAHMNLVLADSQEYRKIKSRKAKARAAAAANSGKAAAEDDDQEDHVGASTSASDAILEQKRTLGLLILRGENIVSMAIEAPPPADDRKQPTVSLLSCFRPTTTLSNHIYHSISALLHFDSIPTLSRH